jgi:hypothetical protein
MKSLNGIPRSIFFQDPELLERAQHRARGCGVSFSKYVTQAVLEKLEREKDGPLTLGDVRVFPEHVYQEQRAEAGALRDSPEAEVRKALAPASSPAPAAAGTGASGKPKRGFGPGEIYGIVHKPRAAK